MGSSGLNKRIQNYFLYIWSRQEGVEEAEVLQQLPRMLRQEVALQLHKHLLEKCALFMETDEKFLESIIFHLKPEIYPPSEFIITENDIGHEMFFLARGEAKLVKGREPVAALKEGTYFGEVALLVPGVRRSASVVATTFCEVLVLDKDDFENVLKLFPAEQKLLHRKSLERMASMKLLHALRNDAGKQKEDGFARGGSSSDNAMSGGLSFAAGNVLDPLRSLSFDAIKTLGSLFLPCRASKNSIFLQGSSVDSIYFVGVGSIQYRDDSGRVVAVVGESNFFGKWTAQLSPAAQFLHSKGGLDSEKKHALSTWLNSETEE